MADEDEAFGDVGEVDFDLEVDGNAGEDGRVVRSELSWDVPEVDGGPGSRARDGDGRTVAIAKAVANAEVKRRGFIVRLLETRNPGRKGKCGRGLSSSSPSSC